MLEIDIAPEKEKLQEKCGIVGWYSPDFARQLPLALTAAGGVQHRGQQGAGIALKTENGLVAHSGTGLLREIFTPELTNKLNEPSKWILVHCRYGTYGTYDENNLQPCIATSPEGEKIAVIHNGEFVATDEMRKLLSGTIPDGASDTYLFANLLAHTPGSNWEEKIKTTLSRVKGAYSLIIGVGNSIFVARDPFGIRPLFFGKNQNGWLVASESHAFDKINIKPFREVKRGKIIKIDENRLTTLSWDNDKSGHFCDFEGAYFMRPESLLPNGGSSLSAAIFRERCGEILAEENSIPHASFVVGVPDSGVALATGYAKALNLPYRQVIVRDHYDQNGEQRLFMRDDEAKLIGQKVLGKLSFVPDKSIWQDAVVVVGDDSIVRGNVSKKVTKTIKELGAKEVHWVIGFPPITHTCHLGVSMRTKEELIAARHNGDSAKVAEAIGATSVRYISHEGFIRARTGKKPETPSNPNEIFLANGGCGGCITGVYPITKEGIVFKAKEKEEVLA